FKEGKLCAGPVSLETNLGTSALLAASYMTLSALKQAPPQAILIGDKGEGKGTKKLFAWLKKNDLNKQTVICGHYMMPYVEEFKQIFPKLRQAAQYLVADAGMMYAAKGSGLARKVDVFTPDAGELAFLADKNATHPAYVKRILFEMDTDNMEDLIKEAYVAKNLPEFALVKGREDLIVKNGKIITSVSSPMVEAMEAIGGTGDALVGILSALITAGFSLDKASILAAKINRIAGNLAQPTPATTISEIIKFIPKAIKEVIK
ncbi:MAG TPA: sugar kinase, partial [Candidatus Desulfofervidus auxilii]|nr:sugar kinase [Candidatus Desulfofervidus auxilii]